MCRLIRYGADRAGSPSLAKTDSRQPRSTWIAFYGPAELYSLAAIGHDVAGHPAEAEADSHRALAALPGSYRRHRDTPRHAWPSLSCTRAIGTRQPFPDSPNFAVMLRDLRIPATSSPRDTSGRALTGSRTHTPCRAGPPHQEATPARWAADLYLAERTDAISRPGTLPLRRSPCPSSWSLPVGAWDIARARAAARPA